MPVIRCASCGKFKKESECVILEETDSDGFQLDQYVECKDCMSDADREIYFKENKGKER